MRFTLGCTNLFNFPIMVKAIFPRLNMGMRDAFHSEKDRMHVSISTGIKLFELSCL